jgi:FKBP-type peptidyl-prolyl cis-trans isomerase SlyD
MADTIQLHDFVEVDYTGKLPEGVVFDTTSADVAKKNGIASGKTSYGPLVICVGERQILPGIDAQLVGKEIGKSYIMNLSAEQAFGKRDIKKMRIVPINNFREHNLMPQPGLQVDVDGEIGFVTSVSGGRVIVNFNHPLAGKDVVYDVMVKRKISDVKEKIEHYVSSMFRLKKEAVKVSVDVAAGKATVDVPFMLPAQFFDAMSKRLQDIIGLKEVEIKGTQAQQKEVV